MDDNKALLGGAEEIVAALERACHDCNPTPCCEYEVIGQAAAALIKDQAAQLAALTAKRDAAAEALMLIDGLRRTDEYIPLIFTHGGCWRFYKFLKLLFPAAVPYKVISEPTIRINRYDHIITKIGERYFDVTGEVRPADFYACEPVVPDDVPVFERWSFAGNHLLSMVCPHCGEDIAIDAEGDMDRPQEGGEKRECNM